jgi:processive 1,2-diacylglycerol beta-glucosyltransferase
MIIVRDKGTGADLGTISDEQLQELADHLEEEDSEDTDYYINVGTVDMLEEKTGDPDLVAFLRKALGDREDMDIEWERA